MRKPYAFVAPAHWYEVADQFIYRMSVLWRRKGLRRSRSPHRHRKEGRA